MSGWISDRSRGPSGSSASRLACGGKRGGGGCISIKKEAKHCISVDDFELITHILYSCTHTPSTAPGRVEGGGQPVLSFEQCFILFSSFPLHLEFVVGGLGFVFCVFVAGWRHASE